MADSITQQLNRNGNRRGMHPNSRKNLTPANGFKPGQSGNPNGSPKKDQSITMALRAMQDEEADERWLHTSDYGKHLTWAQATAKRLWIGAVRGEPAATSQVLDRLEGKSKDTVEMNTTISGTIKSEVKIIGADTLREAVHALVAGGTMQVSPN